MSTAFFRTCNTENVVAQFLLETYENFEATDVMTANHPGMKITR